MRTIIATIRQEHLNKIRAGLKSIEIRKTVPKEIPFRVLCCGKGVLKLVLHEFRESVLRVIDEQPTINAKEVVCASWVRKEFGMGHQCSRCGHIQIYVLPNYCQDCGAEMIKRTNLYTNGCFEGDQ